MATLSNEKINEIKNSVDIVDIVSRYMSLTKKGKNYFGVCPFHEDGDPSMSVSPDKQIFSCFSCHTAGNVFKFLMEYEHIRFIEAVKMCADIGGVSVDVGTISKSNFKQNKIYDIYEIGQKFYLNNINTQFGKEAKEYLNNRGINEEMIKEFEIGLAIKSTDTLSKLLLKKEFNDKDLNDSGLIVKDAKGFHDFFYDRVMFPLHDINGKVIGYSGRIYYKSDAPKYINSKEHPLFKKGEFIYNYQRAKNECRIKNTVIIMEGFMDVIRAHSVGIKNAVATLGTAFTKEHANLVRKLAKNVVICFDGDKAGAKATMACSNILISLGIIPKIVRLEENLDPDEYVLKYGKERFIEKIENPISVMDFKLNYLKNDKDMTQTVDKAKYATEMLEELNKIDDEVLREVTINKISKETDLDIEFLKSKLEKKDEVVVKKVKTVVKTTTCDMAQLMLLFYMLRYKEVIKMIENKSIYFPNKDYRLLSREIISFYKSNGYIEISEILNDLDDSMAKTIGLTESLELKEEYNQGLIDDCIKTIRDFNIDNEYERLFKQLSNETDSVKKAELGQKIVDLIRSKGEENV